MKHSLLLSSPTSNCTACRTKFHINVMNYSLCAQCEIRMQNATVVAEHWTSWALECTRIIKSEKIVHTWIRGNVSGAGNSLKFGLLNVFKWSMRFSPFFGRFGNILLPRFLKTENRVIISRHVFENIGKCHKWNGINTLTNLPIVESQRMHPHEWMLFCSLLNLCKMGNNMFTAQCLMLNVQYV